jgi:hypothetical protein
MASASEISQTIVDFLRTSTNTRYCDSCGRLMEHIEATFHFAGQDWELALPVCPRCEPVLRRGDIPHAA